MIWFWGHAIGQRPLLTLGVLLVVVGIQFVSLGLLSEMITSQHEERMDERERTRQMVEEVLPLTSGRAADADFVGPRGNATDKYDAKNPVTRALLARFLREIDASISAIRPSSLLDVGCGEGVVTERLAQLTGVTTVGVDLDTSALRAEWQRREAGC